MKEVREVQLCHALGKLVPAVRASAGKVTRAEQLYHAELNWVPESNPVALKEVREEQLSHALLKLVPAEKSIDFGVTRSVLPRQ